MHTGDPIGTVFTIISDCRLKRLNLYYYICLLLKLPFINRIKL